MAHHRNLREFQCTICPRAFNTKSDLSQHSWSHKKTATPSFHCDICGESFNVENKFRAHVKNHQPKVPKQLRKAGVCTFCNKQYTDVQEHINLVHLRRYACVCPICNVEFISRFSLDKHIRFIHNKEQHLECLICKKRFAYKKSLQRHLEAHERKISKAPIPSMQQRMHHEKDYCYTCHKCVGDMKVHAAEVHKDFKYECDVCFRRFKKGDSVSRHKNIFHDENPTVYYCDHCPRSFLYKDVVKKHLREHHKFDLPRVPKGNFGKRPKAVEIGRQRLVKKIRRKIVPNRPVREESENSNEFVDNKITKHEPTVNTSLTKDDEPDKSTTKVKIEPKDESDDVFVELLPEIRVDVKIETPDEINGMDNVAIEPMDDGEIKIEEPEDFDIPMKALDSTETDVFGNVGKIKIEPETSDEQKRLEKDDESSEEYSSGESDNDDGDSDYNSNGQDDNNHSDSKTSKVIESPQKSQNDEDKFECNQCQKLFKSRSAFIVHMKSHTDNEGPSALKIKNLKSSNLEKFRCENCRKNFYIHSMKPDRDLSKLDLDCTHCKNPLHKIDDSNEELQATKTPDSKNRSESDASTKNEKTDDEHPKAYRLKCKENDGMVLRCAFCNEGFKFNNHALKRHVITIHENGKKPMRTCQLCHLDFQDFINYEQHIKSHVNEFICLPCGAHFASANELLKHDPIHKKTLLKRNNMCNYCGKAFNTMPLLKVHIMKHTGEFQHECKDCNLKFRGRANYVYHMKKYHEKDGKTFVSYFRF